MAAKRAEEERCDSGLGSLGEGSLWSLPGPWGGARETPLPKHSDPWGSAREIPGVGTPDPWRSDRETTGTVPSDPWGPARETPGVGTSDPWRSDRETPGTVNADPWAPARERPGPRTSDPWKSGGETLLPKQSDPWAADRETSGIMTSDPWRTGGDTPGIGSADPWRSGGETLFPRQSDPWKGDGETLLPRGGCGELDPERLDSALGESLQEEDGACEVLGELAREVQEIRLELGEPEHWAGGVCGFLSEEGDTALHLAVIHEHEAFLDAVLQYMEGTELLDLQNDLGQTALHIAVIIGLPVFTRKLILAGTSLCIPEKTGNTALHLACKEARLGCAEVLLSPVGPMLGNTSEIRKLLDCTNYDSFTALHIAVIRKDLEMVKLLLAAGADINKQELSCGRSPLHLAVESQSPEVVECLLQAGADKDARMYVGYTPIYSAMYRPDQRILQLLRDFGSREPDWDSEESLDMSSDEEQQDGAYDDIVINSIQRKN